jgi:hypothetical protein
MALRLLGRSDVSTFPPAPDLDVGTRIVVIDLRVFVPEVIPVLATYADPSLAEQLGRIPFVDRLIGTAAQPLPTPTALPLEQRLLDAMSHSEINIVQRLSIPRREALTNRIVELARRANLYGTQLEAFAQALQYSVHCTQGPPGTGKSYTGVQLIAALDLVRQAAIAEGHAVGPIITLSYKNHALDEVLLDVLKLIGELRLPGALIRCGKPEDVQLTAHKESTSPSEMRWENELSERLSVLRRARDLANDLTDLGAHLNLAAPGAPKLSEKEQRQALLGWHSSKTKDASNVRASAIDAVGACITLLSKLVVTRDQERAHDAARDGDNTEGGDPRPWSLVTSSVDAYQHLVAACRAYGTPSELTRGMLICIQELSEGAEHWSGPSEGFVQKPASRVASLLQAWLSGLTPPPRCHAAEQDAAEAHSRGEEPGYLCVQIACAPSPFCAQFHMCIHASGCKLRRSMVCPVAPFCEEHRCQAAGGELCAAPRMPASHFCVEHSCPACIHMHDLASTPIDQAMPFACDKHQCTRNGCNRLMYGPGVSFCFKHSCDQCLRTTPTSVLPALPGSKLCKTHTCVVPGCTSLRLSSALHPQTLCQAHACTLCVGTRNMIDRRIPASRLCAQHRCQHEGQAGGGANILCSQPRMEPSAWCEVHSCRVCCFLVTEQRAAPEQIQPSIHEYPRNVCVHHALCSFIDASGAMCEDLANLDGLYCATHAVFVTEQRRAMEKAAPDNTFIRQTCHGITKRGKACKSTGEAPRSVPFYCVAHADQAPSSDSEASDSEDEWIEPGEDATPAAKPMLSAIMVRWSAAQPVANPEPAAGGSNPQVSAKNTSSSQRPEPHVEPAPPENAHGSAPAVAPRSPALVSTCERLLETEELVNGALGAYSPGWSNERVGWRARVESATCTGELAELLAAFELELQATAVLGEAWSLLLHDHWLLSLRQVATGEGSSTAVNPQDELDGLFNTLHDMLMPVLGGGLLPDISQDAKAPPEADGEQPPTANELEDRFAFDLLDPDE